MVLSSPTPEFVESNPFNLDLSHLNESEDSFQERVASLLPHDDANLSYYPVIIYYKDEEPIAWVDVERRQAYL